MRPAGGASPRTRENRTRYVALGMLTLAPMSVYDLRRAIEGSVGHFWMESYGQLYPTLRALAAEGLVKARTAAGSSGREATVYEVSRRGRAELAAWLARPPARDRVRSELLVKLFFGAAVPPEVTARNLDSAAAGLRAELAALEAIAVEHGPEMRRDPVRRFSWLTLDYGLGALRAGLDWLARAREAVLASAGDGAAAHRSTPRSRGAR
jgi:DNA-binding PadR family transcriptional regulator